MDEEDTCVALAGAKYPSAYRGQAIKPMEGVSLASAFAGKPLDREAIYWEREGNRAIRMGEWKLVAKGPAGPCELYDIDADRAEMHDLAAPEPQRVAAMAAKWEAWAKRTGVVPWTWKPACEAAVPKP